MSFGLSLLSGTKYDISKFDYSPFGLVAMGIHEERFKQFLKENYSETISFKHEFEKYEEIINKRFPEETGDLIIAFFSTDLKNPASEADLFDCFKTILLAFPSSLHFNYLFDYTIKEGKLLGASVARWDDFIHDYDDNLLTSVDAEIPNFNKYLEVFKDRISNHSYIKHALNFYTWSFTSSSLHESYISLVTCLEAIVKGREQLSYVLRRNVSVLTGESVESCKLIYNNVKKIYNERSNIVHGHKLDYDAITKYIYYLRSIASRAIIELISCNLSVEDLNEKINISGYGERNQLSNSYIELVPSVRTFQDIQYDTLD